MYVNLTIIILLSCVSINKHIEFCNTSVRISLYIIITFNIVYFDIYICIYIRVRAHSVKFVPASRPVCIILYNNIVGQYVQ